MSEQGGGMPSTAGMVAGGLVIAGVLLSMFVADSLIVVAAAGAFGPGMLRELGVLRDQDEFQRQAAHRAGYHAYLLGGLVTALIVAAVRWDGAETQISSEWIMLILVLMWGTWLFSSLLAYWGARRTASRVLVVFGSFWTVFVLASIVGESGTVTEALLGTLVGLGVVAPFFLLAWTAGRWPRGTGIALLVVCAAFLAVFGPPWAAGNLQLPTVLVTSTLLLLPLVAPAIALLRESNGRARARSTRPAP